MLGSLQFGTQQNITIFLNAKRNTKGDFQFINFNFDIIPVTEQYFSLLKLEQDSDFSLGCLVATFDDTSKYMKLKAVDCEYQESIL